MATKKSFILATPEDVKEKPIQEKVEKKNNEKNLAQEKIASKANKKKKVEPKIDEKKPKKQNDKLLVVDNSNKELIVPQPENPTKRHLPLGLKIALGIIIFLVLLFLGFSIFTVFNSASKTIPNGVFIKDVNVSGMSKEAAKSTIETFIKEHSSEEIILKHNDYESSVSVDQISATFDIDGAVEEAYNYNKSKNMFANTFHALKLLVFPINIEPTFSCDEDQLTKTLEAISPNLPDTIIESGYYVEDNTLVVTKGRTGNIVNVDEMKEYVKDQISELNFKDKRLDIITIEKVPQPLDLDKIYNEIHKEPKDAYFTQDPMAFYPSEEGMDFAISLDEAKAMLDSSEGEECEIPLKVLQPAVTTNMIGNEAFPNQLSEFSTRYVSNANRTTNLRLAAEKINGTVVMPGETFSYNKVVGERTIAAGYKDAAIYVNGQTVDGLAGGICQVSTTLYEAALYANLEIVERLNHQFVPSYIGAGLDATVVYGLTDFQFKNNRNYPIKILCSVANGVCYFQILGLATPDDYQVKINATSSTTATSINSVTYKTLLKNGQVVSKEVISRDTYKRH